MPNIPLTDNKNTTNAIKNSCVQYDKGGNTSKQKHCIMPG